ncbi:gamma-glutamyltransferase [Pseudoalteromonas prydzensis]|uniref:gamma-glutamyltransferase n=1 Tax=Pseudoalteromonas prydzensis TaxID=182141 RepID=UPI0007E4E9B9|nr:gamma-glutamyltransferase [Pseudoalteromonas prydzensis]MBE0378970.1 gamma-glutamyltranspeptidase [Pseudoalteromonas prydzensis ACAM 620]
MYLPFQRSVAFSLTLLALPVLASQSPREVREPEAATGHQIKQQVTGKQFMVAAANPYAAQAGQTILAQGGSAVDAAIATQLVLTLVEPQSSGIGGGTFMLYYNKQHNKLTSFDGRETAPSHADETLFLDENGNAAPWIEAVVGGRSVGVPGLLHAFANAHKQYGKLAWAELFKPAIALAEQGFEVSPRLHALLAKQINPGVTKLPVIRDYFFPDGKPLAVGTVKKNQALADLYKQIADVGIDAFYKGDNAKKMVDAVTHSVVAPGTLALTDLANYQSKQRDAVCTPYHAYKVCSMAPPSSGGVAVLQILALLEDKNMAQYKPNSAQALHYFSQASRLAFADRNVYMGDPDFADIPTAELLDKRYVAQRAKLISERDQKAEAGQPRPLLSYAQDDAYELPSTTHVSIVDSEGNAVSMTSSIEMAFGSTVMVNGYILNNQLTDFALSPRKNGKLLANRVEAGKRPRSSMSPVMVFNNDGSLRLVVGSPGGSRIINYVAQVVIGVLDWQLTAQQAIDLPRITNRNSYTSLEKGTAIEAITADLEKRGHTVKVVDLNSGLHAVELVNGSLVGAADPRREGIALSEVNFVLKEHEMPANKP